jgi:hypothetical protein
MVNLGMSLQQRQQLVKGLLVCSAPPVNALDTFVLSSNTYVLLLLLLLIIINPCKPYLSASATAPHPLGRRKAD